MFTPEGAAINDRYFLALGTASQVPTRRRNHNGYLVRWGAEGFLFDPGEGTQRQMIFHGVSVSEVTKIFITHFHGDHCLGLPGIVQRLSLDGIAHQVDVFYPASGQRYLDNLVDASIFHNQANLRFVPIHEEGIVFEDAHLIVEAMPLDHSVDCWGYRFRDRETVTVLPERLRNRGIRGPDIGRLKREGVLATESGEVRLEDVSVRKRGQSFAFVMDTRVCENARRLAEKVDMLICESTYLASETVDARKNGHLTAGQAADIAAGAGADLLVLTHFSQRYVHLAPFVEEASARHAKVVAVNDGDRVDLPKRKRTLD
ncbi:ribonuclease Z [Sulfidibacter corallicola]|uniref:Ribonuclease Z n=1 Tax=Sulfidibacter corallicola TaxID=2818388 RepID=A0A8A4THM3_SULCO|nr:ribonuclease Z [Sulfidibacter corallicola]QTD49133.1 ribonuclease Z [Sulfidibacter corallicola]